MRKNTLLKVFIFLLLILGSFPLSAEENQPLVSLLLFETDLREALNEISLQTGVNIIMDQTVSGIVTADIQDLPLEKEIGRAHV